MLLLGKIKQLYLQKNYKNRNQWYTENNLRKTHSAYSVSCPIHAAPVGHVRVRVIVPFPHLLLHSLQVLHELHEARNSSREHCGFFYQVFSNAFKVQLT